MNTNIAFVFAWPSELDQLGFFSAPASKLAMDVDCDLIGERVFRRSSSPCDSPCMVLQNFHGSGAHLGRLSVLNNPAHCPRYTCCMSLDFSMGGLFVTVHCLDCRALWPVVPTFFFTPIDPDLHPCPPTVWSAGHLLRTAQLITRMEVWLPIAPRDDQEAVQLLAERIWGVTAFPVIANPERYGARGYLFSIISLVRSPRNPKAKPRVREALVRATSCGLTLHRRGDMRDVTSVPPTNLLEVLSAARNSPKEYESKLFGEEYRKRAYRGK